MLRTSYVGLQVPRKELKGKCKHCGKAFPSKSKLGSAFGHVGALGGGAVVGHSCSWCKYSYHNKDNCLGAMERDGVCDLGQFAKSIVPPSWIVKRPRKGSFKSSLKNSPNKDHRRQRAGEWCGDSSPIDFTEIANFTTSITRLNFLSVIEAI